MKKAPLEDIPAYFFVKTKNPRPTFHLDMTAEERSVEV
jgi:hypothetical protein